MRIRTTNLEQLVLDKNQLSLVLDKFDVREYRTTAEIIYQGHIPTAAILVVDGVVFLKSKKQKIEMGIGALLGLKELIENIPFAYSAEIIGGSKVIILDKSTVIDLLKSKDCHLSPILQNTLAS